MNPKDCNLNYKGFPFENPDPPKEEEPVDPKFQEGDRLFGNRGDGEEFEGLVRDIDSLGHNDGTLFYRLVRNESDYYEGEQEWFEERDLHRLSLLDRVRRLEHFLEIDQ